MNNGLIIAPKFENLLRVNNLDSLDALFAAGGVDRLNKPGLETWRERVRLTLESGGVSLTFYLKRFRHPPTMVSRRIIRRSRTDARSIAGVEWAWITRLRQGGVPCAEPVALAEELDGSRESRSAIMTAAAAGASLESWATRWDGSDHATVRSLIDPLASLVARLHGMGCVHRDLYLCHVFYDPSHRERGSIGSGITGNERAAPPPGAPAPPQTPGSRDEACLRLIDLQRVFRPRWWWRRRWIVKDLASLNYSAPAHLASRVDRIRWLKSYLGLSSLGPRERRLAYRIIGKTERIDGQARRRRTRRMVQPL